MTTDNKLCEVPIQDEFKNQGGVCCPTNFKGRMQNKNMRSKTQ